MFSAGAEASDFAPTKIAEYTAFGSVIDLVADSPEGADPAIWIQPLALTLGGTITTRMVFDAASDVVLAFPIGLSVFDRPIHGKFVSIQSVSLVTRIRVAWL